MKNPTFLLQSGQVMTAEKAACCFSDYPVEYCKFEDLPEKLSKNVEGNLCKFIPIGSVEFVERFSECLGMALPSTITYPDLAFDHLHRKVVRGTFKEAKGTEFVKPCEKVKLFTGGIKDDLIAKGVEVGDATEVWVSERVPFESEFRFYIHDFVTGPKIQGWSRYDDLDVVNPPPDFDIVERISQDFHDSVGPNAYSVDIGWRPDLGRYSLVEVNDGWSLGYYTPNDSQSSPPTRRQYADMMFARWTQIVFCNLV